MSGQLCAAIQPWNLTYFWFDSSGEYLLVRSDVESPPWYEIWHADMTEPVPIETKQATFAKWFHKDENGKKLLWNIPSKGPTPGTTRENHPVVHTVGADEKDDIPLLLSDFLDADISDDDAVALVLREGERYQVFNLKTGQPSTSLANLARSFTCVLSPNSRSLASAVEEDTDEESGGDNSRMNKNSQLSRWDFASSQRTWHQSGTKPQRNVPSPKWNVRFSDSRSLSSLSSRSAFGLRGKLPPTVSIQSKETPPRTVCSIPLEYPPVFYEWNEDDRKLRVFSRDGRQTDIEWDPPEAVEKPVLGLVPLVVGWESDEDRNMVLIPDKKRTDLRKDLETAKVKDPRWQKLLKWWNEERPGD